MDGRLCYQADVNKFRNKVDRKKMVTEGLVFVLDYNENRMVNLGEKKNIKKNRILLGKKERGDDAMIYVEAIGK